MGKVRMMEYERIPGMYEPVERVFEYTYCDKCGSFDLVSQKRPYTTTLIAARIGIGIVIAVLVVTLGVITHSWVVSCVTAVIGWIALLIIAPDPEGYSSCRKCGNEQITDINVLDYPDDMSVLDVPAASAMRTFITAWAYS